MNQIVDLDMLCKLSNDEKNTKFIFIKNKKENLKQM